MIQESDQDSGATYRVVKNHEEQYSIWPVDREIPGGWTDAGHSGPKADCLSYIYKEWTDMRPLSLRHEMEAQQDRQATEPAEDPEAVGAESLVDRLCQGLHSVSAAVKPNDASTLRGYLDRGTCYVKFTDTTGGTELRLLVDDAETDLEGANFEASTGTAHIVGTLTLDAEDVKCMVEIDLSTMSGNGQLQRVAGLSSESAEQGPLQGS